MSKIEIKFKLLIVLQHQTSQPACEMIYQDGHPQTQTLNVFYSQKCPLRSFSTKTNKFLSINIDLCMLYKYPQLQVCHNHRQELSLS